MQKYIKLFLRMNRQSKIGGLKFHDCQRCSAVAISKQAIKFILFVDPIA